MSLLQQQAADLFGLQLSDAQINALDTYERELVAWNSHTNLTAIIDPDGVRIRHMLDSLSLVRATPISGKIIDVGTGAGFPGLVLAIVFPDAHLTLLEATGKKVNFLDHVISTLGLKNARAVKARAEDAGRNKSHRENYDIVVARAVARLPALLEYLLPLAKVGGVCVAMKGSTAQTEADDATKALKELGGTLRSIESVRLPDMEYDHHLLIVEKTRKTPRIYPRQPGTPTRDPL